MLSCGLLARFTRDRYNSLAVVAVVVGLLVFGLIITTIILHLAFLWLVLVSAIIMLFTAFGYSTCTNKQAHAQQLQLPRIRSESISTISDHVAEMGTIDDFPPCYDVVVVEENQISSESKPPSYLDALALQRTWSDKVNTTPHFNCNDPEQLSSTSSQEGSSLNNSLPPPYEEFSMGACAVDQLSASLSEDTSSLGDTSNYTVSSHSSYESLCLAFGTTGDNLDITSRHYSGGGCSSRNQAELHHCQYADV